jgi:hypothetical protein
MGSWSSFELRTARPTAESRFTYQGTTRYRISLSADKHDRRPVGVEPSERVDGSVVSVRAESTYPLALGAYVDLPSTAWRRGHIGDRNGRLRDLLGGRCDELPIFFCRVIIWHVSERWTMVRFVRIVRLVRQVQRRVERRDGFHGPA